MGKSGWQLHHMYACSSGPASLKNKIAGSAGGTHAAMAASSASLPADLLFEESRGMLCCLWWQWTLLPVVAADCKCLHHRLGWG